MDTIDLKKIKKIHFVGIKGVAMAALAVYAKERGIDVTGSDVDEKFPTDTVLKKASITNMIGFSPKHIEVNTDLVIYTGAHGGRDNPEVRQAMKQNIAVLPHGKALGMFMKGKRQITVAGSHGKTTTTSMVATILTHAGLDPSYAIGCGEISGLGLPGHYGKGDSFVAEGDEYATDPSFDKTPRFHWQQPDVFVVTNIDYDHPDIYTSIDQVKKAFVLMQKKLTIDAVTIVNADDPKSLPLRSGKNVVDFGITNQAQYRVSDILFLSGKTKFRLQEHAKTVGVYTLSVPGNHNVLNAAAAAIACHVVGVSWEDTVKGLAFYSGVTRRFEIIEEHKNILFYDDYAHHPKEIEATISGAKLWYPNRRIILVFQPHTYSRTKALLKEFGRSFKDADRVFVTDIYASARESDTMELTSQVLVDEINKDKTTAFYAKGAIEVTTYLKKVVRPDDIVVFVGAGDIYSWEKDVIDALGT